MAHPTAVVLERHLLLYRHLWRASVFSCFVLPVLYLLSLGHGVGGYIGTVQGVDYVRWVAPALLVSTAFQIGMNESTYGILSDFEWVGGLHAMTSTPVRVRDMISGWLLYVAVVAVLAVAAFAAVGVAFDALDVGTAAFGLIVGCLVALSVAAPTTAFSSMLPNDEYFQLLSRFGLIPATLFSGVFFPVDQLPAPVRPLAYLSPLWHGVELMRTTIGVPPAWPVALHAGYLLLCTAAGFGWAHRAFRVRLRT